MNILIIGGAGNSPSANSVCVRNMAREFITRGHMVWNIGSGEENIQSPGEIGGAILWQIPQSYHSRLAKRMTEHPSHILKLWFRIESMFRHLYIIPFYPNTSLSRTRKVLRLAQKIVKEHDIDLIIAINNSFENINAGMQIKKKLGRGIKVVSYHLDLRTASVNTSALIRSYVRKHALNSVVEESNVVDRILIPYSGKKDIDGLPNVNRSIIEFVGFPVYIKGESEEDVAAPFEQDEISISYVGTLSKDNRDPRPFLSIIKEIVLTTGRKIMVHFWGDAGGMEEFLTSSTVASYHGMVDNKYVKSIMIQSDYVLNIGNAIAYNMLPSKVFGMFAIGRPIINIVNHPNDATLPFFERYNNSFNLLQYTNRDETSALADYIMANYNAPLRDTTGMFDDFTPEKICDLILR